MSAVAGSIGWTDPRMAVLADPAGACVVAFQA